MGRAASHTARRLRDAASSDFLNIEPKPRASGTHVGVQFRPCPRKACRAGASQVFDALTYALAELDDPVIDQLVLASVMPAPSSARVLVTLVPSRDDIDPDLALAHVRDAIDVLREEVAAEITRKRAPELVFRIARPDEREQS